MKIDLDLVQQHLTKIGSSSYRTFQANVAQFFTFIEGEISPENERLKQYETDREKKWKNWPLHKQWEMPIDVDEARSLSWNLYKECSTHGYQIPGALWYSTSVEETLYKFNNDFLDHLYQAIQEINKYEVGTDIEMKKELSADSSTVFVVHGRNEKIRLAMFDFLRSIGLSPFEWSRLVQLTGKAFPYIGEILEKAFTSAQAVVIILTPDDDVKLKEEFHKDDDDESEKIILGQPRPNVLFEGGMAMGRHPERTVFVQIGKVKTFSDILGRHIIKMNNSSEARQNLAKRLESCGCSVNLDGTDWHRSGDFNLSTED